MIAMDDPRHLRLRNIVSRAFTPKVVARIEDIGARRARRLVDDDGRRPSRRHGRLRRRLAGPLPLQIICDMMGIPEEDQPKVFHWTNVILGFGDQDIATDYDEFVKVVDGHRRLRAPRWPRTAGPTRATT